MTGLFRGKLTITRGQTVYEFEAQSDRDPEFPTSVLALAERWVFDSPNRLSKLDEDERFRAAQPGDTVQMRTR